MIDFFFGLMWGRLPPPERSNNRAKPSLLMNYSEAISNEIERRGQVQTWNLAQTGVPHYEMAYYNMRF